MLAMLLCLAALGAWKWTHRHDPRLVGRWLVTEDVPATAEELQAATDRTKLLPKTEWTLESDGSGRMSARQLPGSLFGGLGSELYWSTNGDRLRIKWGMPSGGWESIKESADVLYREFRGERPWNPVMNYDYVIERPGLIRVEPRDGPNGQRTGVLYLTRLPEDES